MPKPQSGDEKRIAEETKAQNSTQKDLRDVKRPEGASHEKVKKEEEIEFRILSDNE